MSACTWTLHHWLVVALLGALVTACDAGSAPVPAISQRSTHGRPNAVEVHCLLDAESPTAEEEELFRRINASRAAGTRCGARDRVSARQLEPLAALRCAARLQSRDMAERGFFSHRNPDGRGPQERAERLGFRGRVAENLAWGQTAPANVIDAWIQSSEHCNNLMDPAHRFAGVGVAEGAGGKLFWAQVYGSDAAAPEF